MSVVMSMHWPEVTVEKYEAARREVGWERKVPDGAQFHVAWFSPEGFRVLDLWKSAEAFQKFSETRLMPVINTLGLTTQPVVTLTPAHAIFSPNVPGAKKASSVRKAKPAARRPAKKTAKPKRKKSKR